MNKLRAILVGLATVAILAQSLLAGTVSAAPGALVSVEVSPTSASINSNVSLRFYVTPTDTSLNGVSFFVNLSNLTMVSYSSNGTNFNMFSGLVTGGSAGSTLFEIAAATSSDISSGTKAYVGQVTARTASSVGTGTVSISSIESSNTNNDPIPSTGSNGSLSITVPSTPAPTPTPTPSNSAPSAPSGNVTQNPNPDSDVAVPGNSDSDEPDIIPENELVNALNNENAKEDGDAKGGTEGSKLNLDFNKILLIALFLIVLLALGFAGYRAWDFRRNSKFKAPKLPTYDPLAPNQGPTSGTESVAQEPIPPAQPRTPTSTPTTHEPVIVSPDAKPPEQPPNGSPADVTKTE